MFEIAFLFNKGYIWRERERECSSLWMVAFVTLLSRRNPTKMHLIARGSSFPRWWAWTWTKETQPIFFGTSPVEGWNFGKNLDNTSIGLLNPKARHGHLFIRWAAISTASPQYDLGTFFWNRNTLVVARRWPFFFTATPFCWGCTNAWGFMIPSFWK